MGTNHDDIGRKQFLDILGAQRHVLRKACRDRTAWNAARVCGENA